MKSRQIAYDFVLAIMLIGITTEIVLTILYV